MNPPFWISLISGCTAALFNILLIPIIVYKSSETLGSYKYFLLANTVNAALYALAQAVAIPMWALPPNGAFLYSAATWLPRNIQAIFVYSFNLTLTANVVITVWCFIYRLLVFSSPKPWITQRPNVYYALIVSLMIWAYLVWTIVRLHSTPENDDLFQNAFFETIGAHSYEVAYVGSTQTSAGALLCLGSYFVFFGFAMTVVGTAWMKIRQKLQSLRNLQTGEYKSHYRIYILLTMQKVLPCVFNILPTTVFVVAAFFSLNVDNFIVYCSTVFTFAQVIDPILAVTLITDYRLAIKSWVCKKKTTVVHVTVNSGSREDRILAIK